jgi:hypothetical protein
MGRQRRTTSKQKSSQRWMFRYLMISFELSKSSAVAGLGLRILRGLRLNAPERALFFNDDVQVDRIVRRIGGDHIAVSSISVSKMSHDLDAHAHCDGLKPSGLGVRSPVLPTAATPICPAISISR